MGTKKTKIEPSLEVRSAARFLAEWYVALCDAGMGRRDAIDLTASLASGRVSRGDTPTEGADE